ncbi:TIGR03620 family F420-dependent LLM class oxidoreductase [Actinomadura madurae]|uniref:TIGR03620 family F420-dependent LLM class oxidoreductase n=1 Tax=Actinomadura madurae TaxID=1993 RepID=UPI00202679CE|nr:TIGR03620 family F420-dependent LLM class oxidoreductase [Actinomadura madurae]MCP9955832.1 TIGR03620 family F420-dependent LLM class oxidoreductase [Actinomadura madurae]MCP9972566.1 TIGR03620 family F420-dependent LLM class oxidoreductase [Actinomadura madurae]MCP9985073.1 TIGR03620 family F420-dependent LLM class oxidoreductase [Actinomadura madurae]MCQ0003361.1 TIGR03620 family F420-dependent LLM class oxidoreductase [Actinomadura madurae]MCQ0021290.1 TIGR03620 family F420-dependent LLM
MTAVDEARGRLGRVGVVLVTPIAPAEEWRRAARRVEEAGYGAIWLNEAIGGREVFSQMGMMLAATDRIALGSAIANLWARHPAAMQGAAAVLGDAYPGRLALGVGVSMGAIVEQSGQKWTSPLKRMREYLDGMDASAGAAPVPDVPFPRLVAALGPKMQELARDRADGALPAAMPVEHTRATRERLGPDKLLVVMQAAILETDPEKARGIARGTQMLEMPGSPYVRSLKTLGYDDAALAGGGSDEVIDACFTWGDETAIAKRVQDHLDAGADHVGVTAFAPDLPSVASRYERLAPFLL